MIYKENDYGSYESPNSKILAMEVEDLCVPGSNGNAGGDDEIDDLGDF